MKTVVIGKNSNLSKRIEENVKDSVLLSSRDLSKDITILDKYIQNDFNLVFNNFHPAFDLRSFGSYTDLVDNSVNTTTKVLDYIKHKNVTKNLNKLIYTSSSSVYGINDYCKETDNPTPMNYHGALKVLNEKIIEKYCNDNTVDYTIARVFNVFGGDDNFSVINKLAESIKNNTKFTTVNNGTSIRDFIHVEDIAKAYNKMLQTKTDKIMNIGANHYSIKEIIQLFNFHSKMTLITENIELNEISKSIASNDKLIELMGDNFIDLKDYIKGIYV